MVGSHLGILISELECVDESDMVPTNASFDSKSALVMVSSYKFTKHRRHILCHYIYVRDGHACFGLIMNIR